jgi:DNA-binding GntR family transcriptional regulator
MALIERLEAINGQIDQVIARSDAVGYLKHNLEFHPHALPTRPSACDARIG